MRRFFLFILTLIVCLHAEPQQANLVQALETDFQAGEISEAEYVAYQFYGKTDPQKLPEKYAQYEISFDRKGTLLLQQAGQLLKTANARELALLKPLFSRPYSEQLEEKMISPSGRFKLHYTKTGVHTAEIAYVKAAAIEFDKAFDFICGELGYDVPPIDNVDGPEWDVYLHSIGDYGYSTAEAQVEDEDRPYGATSYIDLDNDMASTYSQSDSALRVTVMHEFFHTVQIGYRSYLATSQNAVWLYEAAAVWVEERSHPDVNDYIQYLDFYFRHADKSLYISDGLHEYGAGLFFIMLQQKYGDELIKKVWNEFISTEAIEALQTVLQDDYATSLSMEIFDHALLNFLASMGFDDTYPDYLLFPEHDITLASVYPQNFYIESTAKKLGYYISQFSFQDTLAVEINPEYETGNEWAFAAIKMSEAYQPQVFKNMGKSSRFINRVTPSDVLTVIPVNVKVPGYPDLTDETFSYQLQERQAVDIESEIINVYPNPFFSERHLSGLTAQISLAKETDVTIVMTNENGSIVYEQELNTYPQGVFNFHWDGKDKDECPLPSGIYLLHVLGGENIKPKKVAIIR